MSNVGRSYSYTRLVYGYEPIVGLFVGEVRVSDWLIFKRRIADLSPANYSQFYIFYTTVQNPYVGECIK